MALLVCAGSLAAPLPALATDITTTVTTAQTLNPGDTLNVTNTGAVAAPTNPAVSIIGGATASFLTNSGTIQSTGSGAARTIRFVTSTTANVTITNNAGAFIQGPGDVIQSNININSGTISIINAGTIRSTGVGGSNGQAIDLDNIQAGTATVNITNLATGVISAADSDAIRPANNATVNNYGQIISNNASAANGNASGNDGIDFNTNTNAGTVNNYSIGLISAARHGITAAQGVTVFNAGTIIGNDGSGINIDSTTNTSITNVTNTGTIIGTAKTADGDGIDVDRLLNLENYGTVKGLGIAGAGNLSEGLAIGGGTINNYAGALIYGAQRAITVDDSSLGNAFAAVNIMNAGTIQSGTGDAIKITSTFNNTLVNSGTIIGSVAMGSGDDTVTIESGSKITGLVDGGANTVGGDTLVYKKVGLTATKEAALQAGQTVNIGGTLYTGFENFTGSTVASFSSFATSGQTSAIASMIDNMTGAANAGTQALIDQVASSSDVNGALSQLTPTAFQGLTTAGVNNSFQTTQMVDQRLSNVRDGGLAFDASGFGNAMAMLNGDQNRTVSESVSAYASAPAFADNAAFAALDKAAAGPMPTKAPRMIEGDSPWGMFLYGNAVFARQEATANSPQSKFNAAGITFGVDRRVTPDLVLGVLGGYTRTNADLDTVGSTSKIDTWLVGGYGTYYRQNWFVNGAFVYGHNKYDNNRIALGTSNTSSPSGDQYAVQGSVGIDLRFNRWIVTPELGAQYTTVRVDSFTEAGAAALNVGADQADSLRSSLGARFRYEWATSWGLMLPELRASWQHEFLDKERDITASFVDQALPGAFATTAAGSGTDFGVLGAGLTANVADHTQVSIGYDFKFGGQDFEAHQISGRLRHVF
jgi:uncharacterized protein with beta-barrel porin domain